MIDEAVAVIEVSDREIRSRVLIAQFAKSTQAAGSTPRCLLSALLDSDFAGHLTMLVTESQFPHGQTWLDLFVDAPDETSRRGEPVTCGVPWPRGLLTEVSRLRMHDDQNRLVQLQARTLDTWPDGSARWVLLDWQANVRRSANYRISWSSGPGPSPSTEPSLVLRIVNDTYVVKTGISEFQVPARRQFCLQAFATERTNDPPAVRTEFQVENQKGQLFEAITDQVKAEEIGPLRSVIRAEGRLVYAGTAPLVHFVVRLHFFAASAVVRFHLTLHNPRKADHPGGMWGLGSGGSVYMRDASVIVSLPPGEGERQTRCSSEPTAPFEPVPLPLELYQDSSGGENWQSHSHFNRDHVVPNTFRGYRLRHSGGERFGLRATPIVSLNHGAAALAVTIPYFWQNFPKAIEATADTLILRLFPRQYADVHELQGGEQKTHVFFVSFARDNVTSDPLAWCRAPSVPHADPSWYSAASAIPYLLPRSEDTHPEYLRLVDAAVEGDDTFDHKREIIDEYGWRHFGDVYGDHEAVFHKGSSPLVSHYNNQYDVVAGLAFQFLGTSDRRWWRAMNELAWHVIDIDIYHTDQDKSLYNGGLFWPTYHYFDADTANHRTYAARYSVAVIGGGPACEHNYTTGLMRHYFITGDEASREAAVGLARWVIDIEDGRRTIFCWLDSGDTGYSSSSRAPNYHGPGRGSANSLAALLDGHRLSKDPAFLDNAAKLIRRVIHPADDIPARNLLDAENRWSYTMFLQSLGKYLGYKAGLGELDFMYAYARASLLHYTRWMSQHEYPYLDKPEILQYPTETWAAQDMRKSEVFNYAALHSTGEERARFLERAEFFFGDSIKRLSGMKTRTLCRPVALMLNCGFMHAWFKQHPEASAPAPIGNHDFGRPQIFVPQRARAKQRFVVLTVSFAALVLLGLIALVLRLVG
jgi:hypothetical protein